MVGANILTQSVRSALQVRQNPRTDSGLLGSPRISMLWKLRSVTGVFLLLFLILLFSP
jgi:hypothetical protein